MGKEFWESFFGKAKEMGFRPRNIIIVILAAFAFAAMADGVSGWAAIPAVVIFYGLDPVLDLIKSADKRRNASHRRDVEADEFKRFLKAKRKELKAKQPELPFSLPPPKTGPASNDDR